MPLLRRRTACTLFCVAVCLSSYGQNYSLLVNFDAFNGANPYGSLVQGTDGNFYGTTSTGAYPSDGTVFTMTPGGMLTKLFGFDNHNSDGEFPFDTLVQATDGNFYGTTSTAGAYGAGTVFEITPEGAHTTIYSFCPQPGCTDGSHPYAGLVQGTDGNLYGTTLTGGSSCDIHGCGTVFKITPEGTLTTLHTFCTSYPCTDGGYPYGRLVQGTDGNFYGTTENTVFKITPGGIFTTLHFFAGAPNDGAYSYAGVVQAKDGNFYGTTSEGGAYNKGAVFRMTPGGTVTIIYSFCPGIDCTDGISPKGDLIQASDGNFYGTTQYDGTRTDAGTVFKVTSGGTFTLLHSFQGSPNDGAHSQNGLVQATDGSFYGMTTDGGSSNYGIVFRLDLGLGLPLSVTKVGNGTVTSGDGYINCGSTCSHTYLSGTVVTLTATPDQGWAFTNWSGCDQSNSNVCTVTMNSARNVTATFKLLYALSVSKTGSGNVISGDGHIYCGSVCSYPYVDGTQVGLTAIPAPGYTFSKWTGCDNAQGSFCTMMMSSAKNVAATFAVSNVGLTSLVLNPSSVKGGNISIATITLNAPAPEGGLGVAITTDQPLAVHPPSLVTVPGGMRSLSFAVRTTPVRATTVANVTASANASQVSATLTVTPTYERLQ